MSTTLPLTELYAPIRADLAAVERLFDEEVLSALPFVNELCDTVRSYRGKMLRPALLLLSARAAGTLRPAHHTLAAVVEMVHMATLVHDDVLDEADERRKRPTVNHVAGNTAAVLLGDYLISHAFHLCSSLESQHASRRIGATTNVVCEGELMQNHLRGQWDLTESAYFEIIRRKTAALTAVACELGAHYAEAGADVVRRLHDYGLSAGMAFQIVDDVLDIAGQRDAVGKTLGRDADLGKLTLPMIHWLAQAGPIDRAAMIGLVSAGAHTELREKLAAAGSLEYAHTVARRYVAEALQQLDALPPSDARSSLTAMAEFIVARQF